MTKSFFHSCIYHAVFVECLPCPRLCSSLKGYNSDQNRLSSYFSRANIQVEEDKEIHKYILLCGDRCDE